jgi:hypothetical protein
MAIGPDLSVNVQGYVNSICTSIMMVCAIVILFSTARRWLQVISGRVPVTLELAEAEV